MRKHALVFMLVFAFFTSAIVEGQIPQAPNGLHILEGDPIQDLRSLGLSKPSPDEQTCGRYFKYSPPSAGNKEKVGILTVVSMGRMRDVKLLPWGTDKFQIRLSPGLAVPRLTVFRLSGPIYPWAEIAISSEDLAKSPCLSNLKILPPLPGY